MDYMSTDFGGGSSSRFPFAARRERRIHVVVLSYRPLCGPGTAIGPLCLRASVLMITRATSKAGGSLAEWLACWTQAQNGPGSNRSRDAVG